MNPVNPLQWQVDQQHLRLLSLFHFVLGGITFLFACLCITIVGAMVWAMSPGSAASGAPPADMMVIFIAYYGVAGLLCLVSSIANIVAGVLLNRRRGKVFLWVNSGINCLNFPIGTTLAVFTFLVLMRDSVIAEFERAAAHTPAS